MLELHELLVTPTRRDVAADPAISREAAIAIEHRFAAHADVAAISVCERAVRDEIMKRLARREHRAVPFPAALDLEPGLPRVLAEEAPRELAAATRDVAPLATGKSELRVLLPVPIRRQLRETAEALFAVAHHLLGQAASQKLTDLAADDAHRLQQAVFRLADLAAVEGQDADRVRAGHDRKEKRAAQAGFIDDVFPEDPRVLADVGDPERLARLPDPADQSDARAEHDLARPLEDPVDRRARRAPELAEAQHASFLVPAPVFAALPVFRLAHRTNRGLQCRRNAVRVGERAGDRMFQPQQLVGALAVGDVADDRLHGVPAAIDERCRRDLDVDGGAVEPDMPDLDARR